ncbi:MAG TPA: choice-of-anchor D domain-containing protein, partial [Streptosporangiaceae bacterium]|nr:choice-of-anchor D domain-containing protein [Streptosporangiaceae bacterium]
RVNGQVYAQPLVVGGTVIAATETNWVYGINAATGRVTWHRHLGSPFPTSADHCTDLQPHAGITSTPVYDPATGSVYVVAETAGPGGANAAFHLVGLDVTSGHITERVLIHGRPSNDSRIVFRAFAELSRPGLLLMNGWVYAAFGSHCDQRPYVGFVAGVSVPHGRLTLWTDEAGVTDEQAGIWQSGGGVMSDRPGRLYVTSGNGVSPPPGPGGSPPGQLAESVIRLAVRHTGTLAARDFFSPQNAPALDAGDTDLGSGGPVGLPFGATAFRRLLVQAGKDGRVFLLDRNHLGGRSQGGGGGNAAVSQAGPYGGQWGHPAAFGDTSVVSARNSGGSHDYVYYLGRSDYLRWLKFRVRHGRRPALTDVAVSPFRFGFTSGSPVVTSSGTSPASAVVWVVGVRNARGDGGTLDAFPAVPPAHCHRPCVLRTIWSAPIGRGSKFSVPATDGARVYVGTRSGRVIGFGSTKAAPLAGRGQVTFGPTTVGSARRLDIDVTARARVTVTGVSVSSAAAPDPFSAGPATVTGPGGGPAVRARFPVSLSAGGRLHVPVRFAPGAPGGVTGALSLTTSSRRFGSLQVPLAGDGTRAGLYAAPGALPFILNTSGEPAGDVPIGTRVPLTTDITNGGTTTQTVTRVSGPSGPFTVTGLPRPGTRLQPGQSIVLEVTFAPTRPGLVTSAITIGGSTGTSATVALSGSGRAAQSKLTVVPAAAHFGHVRVGRQAVVTLTVTNAGNLPATMGGSHRLAAPYGALYPVPADLPLNPGYRLDVPVTFTPARKGAFAATYRITWTDLRGTHTLAVRLTGTGT